MALLDSTDYPAIRAAVDPRLTTADLPDATIALSIYLAAGEAEVLALDPGAESRAGDALARAQRAAIYLVAERLALTWRPYQQQNWHEDDVGEGFMWSVEGRQDRAQVLRALAMRELGVQGVANPGQVSTTYTELDLTTPLW
jgi:hypothetical protein